MGGLPNKHTESDQKFLKQVNQAPLLIIVTIIITMQCIIMGHIGGKINVLLVRFSMKPEGNNISMPLMPESVHAL